MQGTPIRLGINKAMTHQEILLSNCAYWAMNALKVEGSVDHVMDIQDICLRNILSVSREFIYHDPGTDSEISFEGTLATLLPSEGWMSSEIKRWDA